MTVVSSEMNHQFLLDYKMRKRHGVWVFGTLSLNVVLSFIDRHLYVSRSINEVETEKERKNDDRTNKSSANAASTTKLICIRKWLKNIHLIELVLLHVCVLFFTELFLHQMTTMIFIQMITFTIENEKRKIFVLSIIMWDVGEKERIDE